MKKTILLSLTIALVLGFMISFVPETIAETITAQGADFVHRSDGIWFWPLPTQYYNTFSDWAGCPGYGTCPFHNKQEPEYGDNYHTGQAYGHNGFDVATGGNKCDVYAAASGTAYCSYSTSARGYYVVIEHSLGNGYSYYSYYQHLSAISVSNGTAVTVGQTIGKVGNTGGDYGIHLHFGIVLGTSGRGINAPNSLEGNGWILNSGLAEGRILVNPALNSPAGFPTGSISSLRPHAGSVMFTFNKSEVAIGEASANTEQRGELPAYDQIFICSQHIDDYKSIGLGNGTTNMYDSGCGIFSMVHAYQWLSNNRLSQSGVNNLISELIQENAFPYANDLKPYYSYLTNHNILQKQDGRLDYEGYKNLFMQGGCVLLHPQGHYSLAVGMTQRDLNNDGVSETYVHVIDSVIQATLGRWNDAGTYWTSHGYSAYYPSFIQMNPNTSNCGRNKEFDGGGEYWIDYNSFSSIAEKSLWPKATVTETPEPTNSGISGNTSGSTVFYVNTNASESYITLKSSTGSAYVDQHFLGIHTGYGNETHHGFYWVSIAYVDGQYQKVFAWAPSATKDGGNAELFTTEQLKIDFSGEGCFRVEIKPMSNDEAKNYWKVDSIVRWDTPAKWNYTGTKSNCVVTKNIPTVEFSLASDGDNGVPSGNLPQQSYELMGIVTASENIQSITGTIYDISTGQPVPNIGTNPIPIYPNSTYVNIQTSQVNYSLKFQQIPYGTYEYVLVVKTVSGTVRTVADSVFTIGSGTPAPTGDKMTQISAMTVTKNKKGDVTGDGVVDGRDLMRFMEYFAGQSVSINTDQADVTGDGVVDGRDVLRLESIFSGEAI